MFLYSAMLDLKVLSYESLGYPWLEPSMPVSLSLRRGMWLALYAFEPLAGDFVHLIT